MKKFNVKIKAVIFDMDGVITNTMPDHFRAWKKILQEEGVKVTHFDIYSREGQKGICSVEEIFALYKKPFAPEKFKGILDRKEKYFKTIVRQRFIPGARNFLKVLHREGFKLALVTGTSRHELHQMLPDSIYRLFDVIVTGSDVQNGKPHPEPYLRAMKKLAMKASEVVVIENAPFGIRSAKTAGLRCFALQTSLSEKYLKEAAEIFPSVASMQERVNFSLL